MGKEHKQFYEKLSRVAHFSTFAVGGYLDRENVDAGSEINVYSRFSKNSVDCDEARMVVALLFCQWHIKKMGNWYPDLDLLEFKAECAQLFSFSEQLGITAEVEA